MAEITLTKNNFDREVMQSPLPILVDFWAPWCGPCRMLAPILEEVAHDMAGKATIGKVNVDEEPELAEKYQITSIPTLLVFRAGQLVSATVGGRSKEQILELLA